MNPRFRHAALAPIIACVMLVGGYAPTRVDNPTSTLAPTTKPTESAAPTYIPSPSLPAPVSPTHSPTTNPTSHPLPATSQRRIVYVSGQEAGDELYLMAADGSNKFCLTCGHQELRDCDDKAFPEWSPDGRRITFLCYNATSKLYLMNADGSDLTLLGRSYSSAWFPDGGRLLFALDNHIQIARADGTLLTSFPGSGGEFDVSPEGDRVIFTTLGHGHETYLWLVDLNTGEAVRLLEETARDLFNPTWLADGKRIVYIDTRADGTNVRILDIETTQEILLSQASGSRYAWLAVSPDKAKFAFTCSTGNNRRICVVNSDGSGRTVLPFAPVIPLYSLSWSPDSKWILFSGIERMEDNVNIYRIAPNGTGLLRLTDHGGEQADWAP